MPSSKLIKNCIGAVLGTAIAATLPDCAGDSSTHFRTNDIPSITIPVGECKNYAGGQLLYLGMDPEKGIFYLNNASVQHPVTLDTLKHQLTGSDITNLFLIENVSPQSLTLRNVGFNKYQ